MSPSGRKRRERTALSSVLDSRDREVSLLGSSDTRRSGPVAGLKTVRERTRIDGVLEAASVCSLPKQSAIESPTVMRGKKLVQVHVDEANLVKVAGTSEAGVEAEGVAVASVEVEGKEESGRVDL